MNEASVRKPGLWWRLVGHRLPWNRSMRPDSRVYGTQPYLVQVRRNGHTIGHHPVESWQNTTGIVVDRWDAFYGLITGRLRFTIMVRMDPEYSRPRPEETE